MKLTNHEIEIRKKQLGNTFFEMLSKDWSKDKIANVVTKALNDAITEYDKKEEEKVKAAEEAAKAKIAQQRKIDDFSKLNEDFRKVMNKYYPNFKMDDFDSKKDSEETVKFLDTFNKVFKGNSEFKKSFKKSNDAVTLSDLFDEFFKF